MNEWRPTSPPRNSKEMKNVWMACTKQVLRRPTTTTSSWKLLRRVDPPPHRSLGCWLLALPRWCCGNGVCYFIPWTSAKATRHNVLRCCIALCLFAHMMHFLFVTPALLHPARNRSSTTFRCISCRQKNFSFSALLYSPLRLRWCFVHSI